MGVRVPPAELEETQVFAVWPDNWNALDAFLAVDTQWRVSSGWSGMRWQGLDYGAVAAVLNTPPKRGFRALMGKIRHIEAGALEVLNEASGDGA